VKEEGLVRALGVRGLTAGIINYTVGAGIFVLPALVAAKVGAAAPVVYLVCVVAMGLIVLCFAAAGSRVSMSGGAYAYAEEAFGPYVGFLVAVSLWLSTILASASVANVFVDSLAQLSPALGSPVGRDAIMVLLYGILAAINIRGVKIGSGSFRQSRWGSSHQFSFSWSPACSQSKRPTLSGRACRAQRTPRERRFSSSLRLRAWNRR
jgi:APA family basic amino acid/polyamine antiporter